MRFTLTFCTRYNGVYISTDDLDEDRFTVAMWNAIDEVSNTLPSYTYEWAEKFNDHMISDEHIEELKRMAAEILSPAFEEDITPDDIEFEYDHYSS